jgi:deoxyribodipyrimidine photolyase-related protein
MSNHCDSCCYAPTAKEAKAKGRPTCPYTVLYWNFLDKHEAALAANPRTALMAKNVARLSAAQRAELRATAADLLERLEEL